MPIFDSYVKGGLLRWYNNSEKRNRNLNICVKECTYRLMNFNDRILPFILLNPNGSAIVYWRLYKLDGSLVTNFDESLLDTPTVGPYSYVTYNGQSLGYTIPCGFYEMVIRCGADFLYSETIYVSDADLSTCCNKLSWSSECDIGNLLGGFINEFYFDTLAEVCEADFKKLKQVKQDGELSDVTTFQKITPQFMIETGLVPYYVIEALEYMLLHDIVELHLKNGLGSGVIKNVTITHNWEFDSCYCNAKIIFEVDDLMRGACCDSIAGANQWIAPHYHAMQRAFEEDAINEFTISSLLCNGIEQLPSPITFSLDTNNIHFAIGLDGNLHLTNMVNIVNAYLPVGYQCYDDMRVIDYPAGETYSFVFHLTRTDGFGTLDFDYTYDPVDGFQY
jgi:hypothetical protein